MSIDAMRYFKYLAILIAFAPILGCQNNTTTVQSAVGPLEISTDELLEIVGESYIYGYPLVLMDLTKKVATNIERPHHERPLAPINQLGHFRRFPDHTLTAVVKPNVDTYYSIAWLDLTEEPQVLYMPPTERYYLLPFLDAYSNVFASPGTRTTGTDELNLFITGPDYKGLIPEGYRHINAPTNMVWMLGRTMTYDDEDGDTVVRAIQDSMRLVPYGQINNPNYVPPAGTNIDENQNIIPIKSIQDLDIYSYLNRMADLMVDNPPTDADSLIVKKMAKIGLTAGQTFQLSTDNLILQTKLNALPRFIHKRMADRRANPDTSLLTNGWGLIGEGIGTYGTDYLRRAYVDFVGLGANLPEDAVYPNCAFDINGDPLDASKQYHIHFEKDDLPPVNAFWSLTAYNEDEFLIKNEINRYALGDRNDLKYNEDGSLDIFLQFDPPEFEYRQNWLPIPEEGPFYLTLRLYWPKEQVFNGGWEPPFVVPLTSK